MKTNGFTKALLIIFVLVIIVYVTAITGGYRADNGIGCLENITPSNWLSSSPRESSAAINFRSLSSKFYGNFLGNGRQNASGTGGNYEVKKVVVVKRGEPMWAIVRRHYSSEFNGHKLTLMIREINNIEGDEFIQPGQKLKLPYVDE